jgi:hypothetical protein
MPTVFLVIVEIEGRSPRYPDGKVAKGYFIFVDDVVTIVDEDGKIVTDQHGKIYTRKLEPPHNTFIDAELTAGRLFKELRLVVLGKTPREPGSGTRGFGRRPLDYPKSSIA